MVNQTEGRLNNVVLDSCHGSGGEGDSRRKGGKDGEVVEDGRIADKWMWGNRREATGNGTAVLSEK